MNIYLLRQDDKYDWDTYDSCVVCAENEDEARMIHPDDYIVNWDGNGRWDWAPAAEIKVTLLGTAIPNRKKGVICASFNAG